MSAISLPIRVPGVGFRGLIAGLSSIDPAAASGSRPALARLPVGNDRRLVVVDSSDRIVYHVSASLAGTELRGYAPSAKGGVMRARDTNSADELLVAVVPVPETGWRLILEEPWYRLASTYRGATRLLLALLLLGLLLPALAASYAELEQRVEERTRELNALYEQAKETATPAERNRLARELHDSVTQTISRPSSSQTSCPSCGSDIRGHRALWAQHHGRAGFSRWGSPTRRTYTAARDASEPFMESMRIAVA